MKMRKAQIKMGETIAVLIVFFILLMFGLIFYSKFREDSLRNKIAEQDLLNKIDVATRISLLPELQCTSLSIECGNSIDLYKLMALAQGNKKGAQQIPGNPYYDLFHASKINYTQVYPLPGKTWIIYDYPMDKTSYKVVYVPMTMHNPKTGEFYFGYLTVKAYA